MAASHDKRKARATSASAEGLVIYDLDDDGPRRLTDHFIAVVASHMQEGQHGRDEHLCLLPAALGVHEAHVDTLEKAGLIETRHAGTWSIERGDLCVVPDAVRDLCCDAVAARKALEGEVEANWQEPAVDEDPFGSKRQSLPLNERARAARPAHSRAVVHRGQPALPIAWASGRLPRRARSGWRIPRGGWGSRRRRGATIARLLRGPRPTSHPPRPTCRASGRSFLPKSHRPTQRCRRSIRSSSCWRTMT